MEFLAALAVLLSSGLVTSSIISTDGYCGILDNDVKTALDDTLGNLPWRNEDDRSDVDDWDGIVPPTLLPGLTLGKAILSGLDGLRPDRPYQIFCKGNQKLVLFHLRSDRPLSLYLPWKLFGEYDGMLHTSARVEYEGEISITNTTDSVKPELTLKTRRSVVAPYISIDELRAPTILAWTVTVLSYVFYAPLQESWLVHVSHEVGNVLEKRIVTV